MALGDRKIYLDIAGRMHSLYKELVSNPPSGYQFITQGTRWDKLSRAATRVDVIYSFQERILGNIIRMNLAKAYLERFENLLKGQF